MLIIAFCSFTVVEKIFNLFSCSRLFNIDRVDDGKIGVLRARVQSVLPYVNLDSDYDGITDSDDPDLDGDGCPNTEDEYPYDPNICSDQDQDISLTNLYGDIDSSLELDSPYDFTNVDYGVWRIEVEDPSNALISVKNAHFRYPYTHAYAQSALSIVHPQIYHFQFPPDDTDTFVNLKLSAYFPNLSQKHYLIATHTKCPPIPVGLNLESDDDV